MVNTVCTLLPVIPGTFRSTRGISKYPPGYPRRLPPGTGKLCIRQGYVDNRSTIIKYPGTRSIGWLPHTYYIKLYPPQKNEITKPTR